MTLLGIGLSSVICSMRSHVLPKIPETYPSVRRRLYTVRQRLGSMVVNKFWTCIHSRSTHTTTIVRKALPCENGWRGSNEDPSLRSMRPLASARSPCPMLYASGYFSSGGEGAHRLRETTCIRHRHECFSVSNGLALSCLLTQHL